MRSRKADKGYVSIKWTQRRKGRQREYLRTSLVAAHGASTAVAGGGRALGRSHAIGVALGSVGRCLVYGLDRGAGSIITLVVAYKRWESC